MKTIRIANVSFSLKTFIILSIMYEGGKIFICYILIYKNCQKTFMTKYVEQISIKFIQKSMK